MLTKLTHHWFSHKHLSPILKIDTTSDSHQSLRIPFHAYIDPRSSAETNVDTSPTFSKKDGESPLHTAVLGLMISIFDGTLIWICSVSLSVKNGKHCQSTPTSMLVSRRSRKLIREQSFSSVDQYYWWIHKHCDRCRSTKSFPGEAGQWAGAGLLS